MTPFPCCCGEGTVRAVAIPGRLYAPFHRRHRIAVPADYVAPTCDACLDLTLTDEEFAALERVLRPAYLEWQRLQVRTRVDALCLRHQTTVWRIESACGVSRGEIQAFVEGRSGEEFFPKASFRLLEAFVDHPEVFEKCAHPTEVLID